MSDAVPGDLPDASSGAEGSPAATSRAAGKPIGSVLDALRPEFPDLTVSKLRYLDAQGLVSPTREGSGYRRYRDQDVQRLRFVLTAQRDRFWPLKVIAEALDAHDRGLPLPSLETELPRPATGAEVTAGQAAQALAEPSDDTPITFAEVGRAAGLDARDLRELESFHLINPDNDGYYRAHDVHVARLAAALSRYGLQARHLRSFRIAAEREISLVSQVAGSDTEQESDLLALTVELHIALVRAGLAAR